MKSDKSDIEIDGKPLSAWDGEWVEVAGGFATPQPKLRSKVGLYRAVKNGQTVAIGSGTDRLGGLAKRIADFRRSSTSAREHHAGERINAEIGDLTLEVLIAGSNNQHAREVAEILKKEMKKKHLPKWNAPESIVKDAMVADIIKRKK